MRHLQIRIKHLLDVTVQSAHDGDPRPHCRAAAFRDEDQSFHGDLPIWRRVLVFGQFHDVVGGILQRAEPAAIGKRNRFVKRGGPGQ